MIDFEHKLPSLNIDGKHNGTYNNPELAFPSILTTADARLGTFMHTLRSAIYAERRVMLIDGKFIACNLNWIRDNVHIMKASRHWDYHLDQFLNFIIDTQREDGQFYELIKQYDDFHWKYVNQDCYVMYPEDNLVLTRLEIEADIEYLVVEGAVYLYRTTGDNEWLKKVLPRLEKAVDYITSDEKRWDKEHGLVKRAFTIDTWDFAYKQSSHNRRIDPDTPMSIMHGDNSGVYQAMNQLAWFNQRLNRREKAAEWEKRAEQLKQQMFRYLWNGRFFIHQLHLGHPGADDLENERLSLSNPYDINRGVTNLVQSRRIIEEYMARRKTTDCFAEWFSIDPPYSKEASFNDLAPGQYVNGAVSPFTAGELAKAAFNNGYEEYGWDIIQRFMKLVERDGTAYFLYDRDSSPQPQGGPSAWGAASLISAVDEGLAGINDIGVKYDEIYFAPKFPVTPYTELRYITGYEVSEILVDVRYIVKEEGMRYDIYSPAKHIKAHILLPKGKKPVKFLVNGAAEGFALNQVGNSLYADVDITDSKTSCVRIEILF